MPLYTATNAPLLLPNEMTKAERDGRRESEAFKPNIISKPYDAATFEALKQTVAQYLQVNKCRGFYVAEGGEGRGSVLRIVMLHTDEVNGFIRRMNRKMGDENAFRTIPHQTEANQRIAKERQESGYVAVSMGLRSYFGVSGEARPKTKLVIDHTDQQRGVRVKREMANSL